MLKELTYNLSVNVTRFHEESIKFCLEGMWSKSNYWVRSAAKRRFDLFPVTYNPAQSGDL